MLPFPIFFLTFKNHEIKERPARPDNSNSRRLLFMIKEVKTIVFSPTGSTRDLVVNAGEALAHQLHVPITYDSFTLPQDQKKIRTYGAETLVVFGTPTYAGRVPNKALPFVQTLFQGNDTPAVALVTFGNRSYDSSLTELHNELTNHGFHVIAAGAFARRHAFAQIGLEHPTKEDNNLLDELIASTIQKIRQNDFSDVTIKDGAPVAPYYIPLGEDGQPAKFLKAKPLTDTAKCNHCGKCAAVCPMGSINKDNTDEVPGICIKCQACIVYCSKHAKFFNDERFLSHKAMLEKNYRRTAASEIFVK
jgi:ferredoxin/flavodoxin